ncbi:MAG TPA: [FeFe] hydrogenase H-cluster maturation GTPase HydF [bacterium]|nr:[FeFe] hydrogenase H-cluster maturation GTPase HydF [bacterium]
MKAPKSLRLHIGIFGRRNVGKSSLLNALTRQQVSIVSDVAGTTTDPVEKPMELLPLGSVLFIDTAGVDDVGALGEMRVEKTRKVLERTDVGVVVAEDGKWDSFEQAMVDELTKRGVPAIVVFNKSDLAERPENRDATAASPTQPLGGSVPSFPDATAELERRLQDAGVRVVRTVAPQREGILALREALIASAPEEFVNPPTIIGDLLPSGGLAVLVVPIDKEAPRGRLIQPQVQTIRDLLDNDAYCMVVKERELRDALLRLNRKPDIVVTDSQAFLKVAGDTPPDVKLTSFSILFARFKGDLVEMVRGATAIEHLKPGDRVLIAESCSHHPIGDDIGRVKIPRWLTQYVGGKLEFVTHQGHDFPEDVSQFKLVIHCGACMTNRRAVLNRVARCREQGVPITNYGLSIAYSLGIFERALEPFPAALDAYRGQTNRR